MINPEIYDRVVAVGVDIQNDFCPGGLLGVTEGDQVIEPFNNVAEWTRQQDGAVAFTRDMHPEKTGHFDVWPVHCVAGTPGAELHEAVHVELNDRILDKGTGVDEDAYSGFDGIDIIGKTLEKLITPQDQQERVAVLIGGLATDYCVKATVLDACAIVQRDYPVTPHQVGVYVLEDAIRAVNLKPEDEKLAIDEMKLAGAQFVTSEDVLGGVIRVQGK